MSRRMGRAAGWFLGPPAAGALTPIAAWAAEPGGGNWLWRMYEAGGFFMHPILACAVLGAVVAAERSWAWWRDRRGARDVLREVLAAARMGPTQAGVTASRREGPMARVLAHGLARAAAGTAAMQRAWSAAVEVELYDMERGLLWLATVANVAPLLGFLGTVSGMIRAFGDIAAADRVSAQIVAAGIAEALLTTLFGLIVAIPAQVFYNVFVGRVERFSVIAVEAEDDLLHALGRAVPEGGS